ncbi:30S ribosomal protein S1 [uncultured Clostridium sp.]|uniref:S1 RNA-binding domain-containing protein n=1 Tax=Muricoprocola aceti TaxID=2981772 RepID=A0ABT2SL74_9FIRM|nr:S1 RNA-binding domain-containing protein [Muricoprocola aceti]MCU6725236.1 S1 RNA-binding domain-containing protein [Muricoprocola aceti]SCH44243.1 30S ribosomal protein S1 [uncultured Clostridium sp.]
MEEERQELAEKADTAAHTESMADFEEELNASLKQIHEGDVITGTVIDVTEDEVVLDLKYYTEGVIRREDFSADPTLNLKETVQVGDEISATVVRRDGGQGQIMLSKKDAANLVAWDKLRSLKETQSNIRVKVAGIVKSGVIAYVEDIRGFIPASKLALDYVDEDDLNDWLGKELEVRAITVDEEDGKLVLSAKEILREKEAEEKKARISNVQVGLVTEGKVESIQPYGAFIDLGNGLTGLVHISQICEKRIKTPAAVLHVGDEVKVKVIAVKDGKLSLSMKALQDVAAEEIQEESVELPESEELTTNLGSLFANIKLN